MNEIYLKLKKDIQSLTIAGVHLDKKFETKINKLIESVDIQEAQKVLKQINDSITTLDDKFKELEKIIANNKSLPNDVKELQTKVSTLETSNSNIYGQITSLDSKINQNSNDIITINGNISSINTEINGLNSNISTANDNVKNINENSIPGLQTQINKNKSDISSLENNIQGINEENEMIFLDIYKKLGRTYKDQLGNVEGNNITSGQTNIINNRNLDSPAILDGITSLIFYLSGTFSITSIDLSSQEFYDILNNNLEFYCRIGSSGASDEKVIKLKPTSIKMDSLRTWKGTYYCEFYTDHPNGPISIDFNSSKSYSNNISWSANFFVDRYGIPNSQ